MKLSSLPLLFLLASPAFAMPGKSQQLTSPDQTPEGLQKSDWHSIRAAHDAWKHQIQAVPGGWQARNPGQQWAIRFDRRGFLTTPREGGWNWGLELRSYGFGERQQAVGGIAEVHTEGQRLSYQWDDTVEEWFLNDQRGLEHGFTVARRPEGASGDAPLGFLIDTRGKLRPAISGDRQGVLFQDEDGANVLQYTGLKVWDADGKALHSRFEAAGGNSIRLLVEETGARYPLTIDPIAQQAFLKAGNNGETSYENFGLSVAVSGDTVVVGAPGEGSSTTGINSTPDNNAYSSGAAYVFVRNGTIWSQQAYLKASNTGSSDYFGYSVSISDDTVVVGARYEASSTTGINSTPNESANGSGAAYVFVRNGIAWSQQAYLKASNTGTNDYFGNSVAVSGDTVIVGAHQEDSNTAGINSTPNESAADSGAAYVFARIGSTWSQQAYLKASNTEAGDEFGISVAVSGDTVVVGAHQEDSNTTGINSQPDDSIYSSNSGAAYVFVRTNTTWSQDVYLKASNTRASDHFGISVAVAGDTVVVGANQEDSSTTGVNSTPDNSYYSSDSGAAYVFVRSGTTWSQQAYLKASNTGESDYFGSSVAISGDSIIVGAPQEDSNTTGINSAPDENAADSGAAYVFVRNGTAWSQQAYIKAFNTGANDLFGVSVAISGDTVILGASRERSNTTGINSIPNESVVDAGAAYVFFRSGIIWSQQAYIKASNTPTGSGADDLFGSSVAISGDTVVVGAPYEDSITTGVNSTPDDSVFYNKDSGAAYVFVRSGQTWSQQAYLKASNTGDGDYFGSSVAISGDTLVVGANQEDSSSTGVNNTPNENSADSGAAYVFVRSGTIWSQQAYLKASNTGASDRFGICVSVSGNTVVVGADQEDSSTTGVNSTSNNSATNSGAAYVFLRNGSTWSQQAYLKASNTGVSDFFGSSVAISGDTVVAGAYGEDSSTTGVNSTPNESASSSGAAYVFTRIGTTWSQQVYLKASNTGASDRFGICVSVSGNTVVVGAPGEGSSTTGINSTPDNNAYSSGAAYVFVRNGTIWSQQAYLKASNTGSSDYFGYSVSISDDTVVVGANQEDSNTTGVNSLPNESAIDSGAAYVFVRSGTAWSQHAYLKASNTGQSDNFGYSVAVSGDTVIVGSTRESSSATGANGTTDEAAPNSGAAYIFFISPPQPDIVLMGPNDTILANGAATLDCGQQLTYSSADLLLRLYNLGDLDLTGINAIISGMDSGQFSLVGLLPSTLGPGQSMDFAIRFTPTSAGAKAATLSIASNDPDENPFVIFLTGQGATARQLFDSWASAAGLSGASAEPNATPFGDGVPNLLKYAFNMDASGPDVRTLVPVNGTVGLPVMNVVSGTVRFEFLRRKNSDLTYTPQQSSDLSAGGWQPATGTPTVTAINENWERVIIEQAPGTERFFRVTVVLP